MKEIFDQFRKITGSISTKQKENIDIIISKVPEDVLRVAVGLTNNKGETMRTSDKGLKLIQSFEGLRLNAYDDGVGVWTIGYGTTVINGVKVKRGDTCTLEQAKSYMKDDLKRFEAAVNKVTVPLNQNQFDALVSLSYNIGTGAFSNSTLVKKLNKGDYKGAADQFDVWVKAGGKRMQGLVNRRKKEKELFLS